MGGAVPLTDKIQTTSVTDMGIKYTPVFFVCVCVFCFCFFMTAYAAGAVANTVETAKTEAVCNLHPMSLYLNLLVCSRATTAEVSVRTPPPSSPDPPRITQARARERKSTGVRISERFA